MNQVLNSYDYVFCGTGTAAILLLLELEKNNLLVNKTVLLIDPDKKERNDKTFCFWADDNEAIAINLNHLISYSWDEVTISDKQIEKIWPYRYNHISSIELYKQLHRLKQTYDFHSHLACIDTLSKDELGLFVNIDQFKIRANTIFDSRTPLFTKPQNGEVQIYQSFIGWLIETETPLENPSSFRFMDFQIAQQGSTQFMYVLPFTSNKALIEVTRFGAELIQQDSADDLLQHYIQSHYGNFTILEKETGCIPMTNTSIEQSVLPGVILLGARNYQIKPSTGYAFKNMYYHARSIVETIKNNATPDSLNKNRTDINKSRFSFYDDLLLTILKEKPNEGKPIFTALFEKIETQKVLRFLDEKTSLKEEINIFKVLPMKPFIVSLLSKFTNYSWFRPLLITAITLLLMVFQNDNLAYVLFFIGLITVGIPHGALDHLIESGRFEMRKTPFFILKYLFLTAFMALFWYYFPQFSLMFFLIFSAWHFGQADGRNWNFGTLFSILWGFFVLYYLLSTHEEEAKLIMLKLANVSIPFALPFWAILPWFVWAFYKRNLSFIITIIWLMLSCNLPLIVSFALYFIGQHSFSGWNHLRSHLQLSNWQMWMNALPFHLGAWLILMVFVYLNENTQTFLGLNFWPLFFVFIACISFPHSIFMNVVYLNRKGN
jgi:lycopene beta-cyclase